MAFNATGVMLNGGAAGPGGVTGYCVCQNTAANPTNEQLLAMTAEGELADFTAVTTSAVPAASEFVSDVLTPAIREWHAGIGAAATATPAKVWLVRLRDGAGYAKLRITALEQPTAATPGRLTLEYATQASTAGTLGAARTLTVDVPATGGARVDLTGGATTTSATDWDLRFDGWTLRLNGGASGAGRAAAVAAPATWDATTNAYVGTSSAYRSDAYAGVFALTPWYRYNLTGDNRITPTFDVYLVRRGTAVYKIQMTNYYGPAGETRRITVRYERIAG